MAQPRPPHPDAQLINAIKRWKGCPQYSIDDMLAFGVLIGHPHNLYDNNGKIINTDNPEVNRIVDLILGENGHTILKMLEIKYNDKTRSRDVCGSSK